MGLISQLDLNVIVSLVGWLIGGIVVVVGVRGQMAHLTTELALLRQTLIAITNRVDRVEVKVAYSEGLEEGRKQRGG
jgi:hypothetical protein